MKKILILLLLLNNCSFAQTYPWAISDTTLIGGYWSVLANLAKDSSGNMYLAYTIKNAPPQNIWPLYTYYITLIKYDVNHNKVWEHQITAKGGLRRVGLCADLSGNVYVTSSFVGKLVIDSTEYASSVGGYNMFLIKFDSQGNFEWLKRSTGDYANAMAVSTDAQNNVYVGGNYQYNNYFDSVTITNQVHCDFIAKYNTNGQLQWIKTCSGNGGGGTDLKLKTDFSGNTYITNSFYTAIQFDNCSVSVFGSNGENIYIAKIDSSGNCLWVKRAGGIIQDVPADLAIDAQSNLYLTGFIGGPTATFGNITLSNNAGGDNYFAAKYDSSGNALWAVIGTGAGQYGYGICADNQGNAYVSRSSSFISKYDNAGNFLWSQYKGTAANMDMLADDSGSVYIAGYFQNNVSFDSYNFIANQTNTNQMFLAKLYNPPEISTIIDDPEYYSTVFSVFPNPASRIITINIAATAKLKESYTLKVSDSFGKNVYSETLKEISASFTKQIDLSQLPKGIYFLELQSTSHEFPQKQDRFKKIVLQ